MDIQLKGKKVLLTGGTKGIGRGIALAFAQAGAHVLTCSRSEDEAAVTLANELKEIGPDHHVVTADISTQEGIDGLIEAAKTKLGGIDVIIGNAGAISHVPFEKLTAEDWSRVIQTNLTANYLLIQAALPLLGAGSSIIVLGSRSAMVGVQLRVHYTASKAGLVGMARSLAKELGPKGIRVNVLAPGVIEPENAPLPEAVVKKYVPLTSLGRLGRPREIAGAAMFLASDLASYVTGETLNVDGGI
ncbi:MAG: SDR family NAD(P)-dependent oxidoreductase [Micromonosporaceae bacterium]